MAKFKAWIKENLTSILIILGVLLGIIFGLILRFSFTTISPLVLTYLGLPGKILTRAFMMVIIPLIITSISTSISATKSDENKRLIIVSFLLILLFSSFVSIFGSFLVTIIKPGIRSQENSNAVGKVSQQDYDINQIIASQDEVIYDLLLNLVPDNIIGATFMTHYTALVPNNPQNLSLGYKKVAEKSFKTNVLGICIFSFILGFAILHLGGRVHTIKIILEEINTLIMEIMNTMIKIMPIGMFSWMCVEVIKMRSPEKILVQLGWFFATALLAFAILWFIFYPGIYFLVLRKNAFKLYYNIIPAMIVAFGSCSSAVTLPVTMRCMEVKNKLALQVSHFFLPLGMNMHMPGAAMYFPMVMLFVAQMQGVSITLPVFITNCIYTLIQVMAFPATPSGGSNMAYAIAACHIIGIENPIEILTFTHTLDWLMERIRTATNITGDCIVAPIVQKLCHIQTVEEINTKL